MPRRHELIDLESGERVALESGVSVHRGYRLPSTFFEGHPLGRMYGKGGQLVALGRCFREGFGIRAAAKRVGVSKDRAAKLYRILRSEGFEFYCGCGKHLAHQGSCRARRPLIPALTERIARRRAVVRAATARWYARRAS